MINLKQAEAEKRRSAVIILLQNWRRKEMLNTHLAIFHPFSLCLLSVYKSASKKRSGIERGEDAKYSERWARLYGDFSFSSIWRWSNSGKYTM